MASIKIMYACNGKSRSTHFFRLFSSHAEHHVQNMNLGRYGNTISLIDATYKYDLAKTNVGYSEFVVQSETSENISEAFHDRLFWPRTSFSNNLCQSEVTHFSPRLCLGSKSAISRIKSGNGWLEWLTLSIKWLSIKQGLATWLIKWK